MSPPPIILFRDLGCPFAHRVAALLAHLELPYEDRACPIGMKPPGLIEVSPSGRIPALQHGTLGLYDSTVIGEFLSEQYGFAAWSEDAPTRALERLVCRQFDSLIAQPMLQQMSAGRPPSGFDEALDELDRLIGPIGAPRTSWLALHLGPFARLFAEVAPQLYRAIGSRQGLVGWMRYGSALDAVRQTHTALVFAESA